MELNPDADEKAQTQEELLSALRFRDSINKLDKSPPPYFVANWRMAFNRQWRM